MEVAETQRQSLIDAAMASVELIQLKLRAGRRLSGSDAVRLDAVLDYIEAEATDTGSAPDIEWSTMPAE